MDTIHSPTTDFKAPRERVLRAEIDAWRTLAHISSGEWQTRVNLALSLIRHRLDAASPDVLAITRALEGWTVAELAAGEIARAD